MPQAQHLSALFGQLFHVLPDTYAVKSPRAFNHLPLTHTYLSLPRLSALQAPCRECPPRGPRDHMRHSVPKMTLMSEMATVRFGLTKCVAHDGRAVGDAMIIFLNWVNQARFRPEEF